MQFLTIAIFAVAGRLLTMVMAKPVPNRGSEAGGIAIPLTRRSPLLNSNGSIDLDAISFHGKLVEEKMLRGLDNYEVNTGTMHPFAVKRSESGIERRAAGIPLTYGHPASEQWIGEISIGTPAKPVKVQIGTASAEMWVLQTGCRGITGYRDLWDPRSSRSAKIHSESPFRIGFKDGTVVNGISYTDHVTIAGFTADSQTFGSITSLTSVIENNGDADGFLGLAFPSISKYGANPLLESLINERKLTNPTFSFKLSSSAAEMYVGGSNSMLYRGAIIYIPVTHPGFWQVSMDDLRLNDTRILDNVPVVFDTTSPYIYGVWNQVAELYGRLGGILIEHEGLGYYYLPCDFFPSLRLTFGGRTFEIPPNHFRLAPIFTGSPQCFGTVIGHHWPEGFWNVGAVFLQGVYSVFDYGTPQVGFAALA